MASYNLYIDATNGSETNDGLTPSTPKQTYTQFTFNAVDDYTINLMSDYTTDSTQPVYWNQAMSNYLASMNSCRFVAYGANKRTINIYSTNILKMAGNTTWEDIIFSNTSSGSYMMQTMPLFNVTMHFKRCRFVCNTKAVAIFCATTTYNVDLRLDNCVIDESSLTTLNNTAFITHSGTSDYTRSYVLNNCDFVGTPALTKFCIFGATATLTAARDYKFALNNCTIKGFGDGLLCQFINIVSAVTYCTSTNSFYPASIDNSVITVESNEGDYAELVDGYSPTLDYYGNTYDGYYWLVGAIRGEQMIPTPEDDSGIDWDNIRLVIGGFGYEME